MYNIRCDKCGQFIDPESEYSWANIYGQFWIEDTIHRCEKDTEKYGGVETNASNGIAGHQGINGVTNIGGVPK